MKVLSLPSKSLLDTRWINLSIRNFSPREFLGLVIGLLCIVGAIAGKVHPGIIIFGILVIVFGFIPFGFLPPEKQITSFIRFHTRRDQPTTQSKTHMLGYGIIGTEAVKTITSSTELVHVQDLDTPYTIKLKTDVKGEFIPVSIYFTEGNTEIHIADSTTDRHGTVSCTVLLDDYGEKQVRVVSSKGAILYDKTVRFERR